MELVLVAVEEHLWLLQKALQIISFAYRKYPEFKVVYVTGTAIWLNAHSQLLIASYSSK